jgi:hypothetical protein
MEVDVLTQKHNIKGFDYFNLALLSFAALGLELILAFIEPFIYGRPVDFKNWTVILHWLITYVLWGIAVFLIISYAKKQLGFRIKDSNKSIKFWQWVAVIAFKFIMQYFYYFIETILFTLIIVFGQKAFEKWLKNNKIPYGGIICGLTWGIAHIFTKTNIAAGITSAILGFGFGAAYLLLNRDIVKTVPILFLMFVL